MTRKLYVGRVKEMMSIYLIIAIICVILLLATVMMGDFGGDMDFDTDVDMDMGGGHIELGHGDFSGGISPLSLPILLVFGTSFGSFGALLEMMMLHVLLIPAISAGVSALLAGTIYIAMVKVFVKSQATSTIKLESLVGKEGMVSIPIKPGGIGQVILVTDERGRTTVSAVSDQEIATDALVVVKKTIGGNLYVEKK